MKNGTRNEVAMPNLRDAIRANSRLVRVGSLVAAISFSLMALGALALVASRVGVPLAVFCGVPAVIAMVIHIRARNPDWSPFARLVREPQRVRKVTVLETTVTTIGMPIGRNYQILFDLGGRLANKSLFVPASSVPALMMELHSLMPWSVPESAWVTMLGAGLSESVRAKR